MLSLPLLIFDTRLINLYSVTQPVSYEGPIQMTVFFLSSIHCNVKELNEGLATSKKNWAKHKENFETNIQEYKVCMVDRLIEYEMRVQSLNIDHGNNKKAKKSSKTSHSISC